MRASSQMVRIAAGAGSWGDDPGEAMELLSRTSVDYLIFDYLAEITLSIMRAQMDKDPAKGFANDFLIVLEQILPTISQRRTKIVTNAGGLNPEGCAHAVNGLLRKFGLAGRVIVAVVDGDDLLADLSALSTINAFDSLDDAGAFMQVRDRVVSANAYLGAGPIREALDRGADIVITGRCADVSLTIGPLLHEFDWSEWDALAGGAVAGHLLECGSQSTGGNSHDWAADRTAVRAGYPIAEVSQDGTFVLTKAPGTGGQVTIATVTEQLLHEIFDPREVLTPDVTVDWTTIQLAQQGPDRVLVSGACGAAPPPTLKVSMTYRDGYRVVMMWPYAWPDALGKAQAALDQIDATIKRMNLDLDDTRRDVIGAGAIHGPRSALIPGSGGEPMEVIARFCARTGSGRDARLLASQLAPMHYGPAGMAGFLAGGKGQVSTIYTHWATTIPVEQVRCRVQLMAAQDEEQCE